jgi:hypothetical protein
MSLGNAALEVINQVVNMRYTADVTGGWRSRSEER